MLNHEPHETHERSRGVGAVVACAGWAACLIFAAATGGQTGQSLLVGVFNIRQYGAVGDGEASDTAAINKAVEACAAAGGGQVLFPPGKYLSGTIHLKSHVTLFLDAGARVAGTPRLDEYQQPTVPAFMPEARWGRWHRALIVGEGIQDVTIAGQGVIDGNRVFDPNGEERMRGPHTLVLAGCRQVVIRDVSIADSANYAVFIQASDQVEIRNVKITGGWDGVHFRGAPGHPCRDVSIVGCQFYTGDDAIAGRYWENTLISGCVLNSSCNAVRLIGPARHLIVQDCLIYGPGVYPQRASKRTDALAGLNLQPGAWDATQGDLDDVLISDVTMHNVSTPFHFSLKPGNTAGTIRVNRVTASGVYLAAASVESWAQRPFANVVFRDVTIEYQGGGTRDQAAATVKSPGVDARPLPAWGFYARNVQNLVLDDVRLRTANEDPRCVLMCDGVEQLTLEDLRTSPASDACDLFRLNDVACVKLRGTDLPIVEPLCTALRWTAQDSAVRVAAGKPCSVSVTLENGERAGLGRIDLALAGLKTTRWVWLRPNEKKDVLFKGLTAPAAGTHEARCGDYVQALEVEP